VPQAQLTKINGFQSSVQSFINLATPAISGGMMSFAPLETLFFLDVITAMIGIGVVLFLVKTPASTAAAPDKTSTAPAPTAAAPDTTSTAPAPTATANSTGLQGLAYFRDLREGLNYIRKHGYVSRMILFTAVFLFFAGPAIMLTPLQVTRNFGGDIWRLSAMEITFSVGMMAGGLLIGLWGGFKNRIHTMALACAMFGLLDVGLGLTPVFSLYLALMAAVGIIMPLWNAPSMVLFQTTVEPAFMGRALSVFSMVSGVMMPISIAIFGPIADIISINTLLIVTGAVITSLCVPILRSKTFQEVGKKYTL
jgi:DHA3 family macrolide efflux protein-like MFS transporter